MAEKKPTKRRRGYTTYVCITDHESAPLVVPGQDCPNRQNHTPCPEGYLEWHDWADAMAKTHRSEPCPDCGRYTIWKPKQKGASDAAREDGGAPDAG